MAEIIPILESYGQQLETSQTSQTSFETLATDDRTISQTPPSHWFRLFHTIMNSTQ